MARDVPLLFVLRLRCLGMVAALVLDLVLAQVLALVLVLGLVLVVPAALVGDADKSKTMPSSASAVATSLPSILG